MKAQVFIRLKPGVLDVQGKAIERGLTDNGIRGVSDVRVGKLIELDVDATSADVGRQQVAQLCEKLFANPIIESYEVRLQES